VIAARLNEDLTAHPPPEPVDPNRALGRWSPGSVREILVNPKYTGYMVWNRRATKDKQHPGKHNPREEWVISSKPEHPALVPVETFLAAQATRRRARARPDSDPAAPNPHPLTRAVYRLRSFVYCAPCGVRMHGKRNHHGTPYSYCQPRNRPRPEGHPATIWLREDTVIDAVTTFFNAYVLGPDRAELVAASLPAAADHALVQHQRQEETIRRRLDDITDSIDNLIRALERTRSPGGQFSTRTQARIAELEQQSADLTRQLVNHQAARPPAPANDLTLLNHLPVAAIDLNDLSTERLRRFLDAFHVEIHYDVRVRRATVRAEISAELVDRLTRAVGWAARPQPTRAASKTRDENGPADDGGATQTIMHSSGRCPRQDSNLRPRLRRAVLYPLSYGGSATSTTLAGAADG
jgi:site-specific DNA recombinase